jgi:ABC-2 type transport system permease protein
MNEHVRRGTLDFLLTKPFDAQLLVSLRHLSVSNLLDPLLGLALTGVGLALSGQGLSFARLGSFALLLVAAMLLLYALTVVLMAGAVILVAAEELGQISFAVVELSRFPVQLYRDPVRSVLTIVPVAFLTTLPAEALLGRLDPTMLLLAPLVAIGAAVVARLVWRRSLRSYTGASA